MLAQYRLLARIGSGGMGDVWKAFDTRLERDVALKLIDSDHVADPDRRRRLLQEARLASVLNHPNTVTIYGSAGTIELVGPDKGEGGGARRPGSR